MDGPPTSSTPLGGPLSPDSLVRVLRAIYQEGHTGVLNLSRGRERLGLRFLGGCIVSASDGPVGRLGDILLRLGQVTRPNLERALEKAAIEGLRLGPVLVEERIATREQVQEALRLQVRDVLFAAFFWGFGAYRFEADEGPDVHEDINLEMSTPGLIFDVVSCLESPAAVPSASLGLDELEQKRREAADLLYAMEWQSHFAVLGLPEGAPFEDVKRSFVRLAKRYHPDTVRDPELGILTKAIFLRISEACNVLASADSRARYEQHVAGPSRPKPTSTPTPTPTPEPPQAPTQALAPVPTPVPTTPPVAPLAEPEEVVHRAEELLAEGELFEAATLLADILPHTQGRLRQRARLLRARTYLRTPSGYHLAETELRELQRDEPTCLEACVLLGDIYRDHGLARRAQTQYQRAVRLQPGHAGATEQLQALAGAVAVPRAMASARR